MSFANSSATCSALCNFSCTRYGTMEADTEGKFLYYIGVVEETGSIIILRYEKTGAPLLLKGK